MESNDDGYRAAERLASTHICPDCRDKSRLVVRWNRERGRSECWCPPCGRTEGFKRRKGPTEIWREDPDSVPIEVANKLARKYHDEIEAVAEGLPEELAKVVRERYFGPEVSQCQSAG